MAYVNYKWKRPDHTQFTQGDSDATDLRDQITAGAYVLNDSVLKSGGYEILDYDSVWRFGWKACRDYADMEAQAPDFVSVQLPFGGNYYFRSGWSEKASLLHFHCGETGGGHGHADKLHVDLVIRGEDVLVDSGRYTYVDGPDRFHAARTRRRTYIGEDRDTQFYKAVDSMVCPYGYGESLHYGMTPYVFDFTGDPGKDYNDVYEKQIKSFRYRIDHRVVVDHHDMGFIYSLSCVAAYKLTGDEFAKETALLAADNLKARFREKGQFIQAWGELDTKENYRLIIDCLLNLPILYWATEVTGDGSYRECALKHLETTRKVIFRPDYSTYHTYYFDLETGKPAYGATKQGDSDESTWSRGQSWGVYGLMLNYMYEKADGIPEEWKKVTDYFLAHLPQDKAAYWDFYFMDGPEPRDSSASAIAVCGILEALMRVIKPEWKPYW